MSAQVAADLRAAADVLERDGWVQERDETADGCRCVVGALSFVISDGASSSDGWLYRMGRGERLSDAVGVLLGQRHVGRAVTWNDDDERTAAEVIAALRAAADRAEAEQ